MPGDVFGTLRKHVEGRSVVARVEPGRRGATLSHEREQDQHLLLGVPRVGPFGRADAAEDALELGKMGVGGVRRPLSLLFSQDFLGRLVTKARIQWRPGTQ